MRSWMGATTALGRPVMMAQLSMVCRVGIIDLALPGCIDACGCGQATFSARDDVISGPQAGHGVSLFGVGILTHGGQLLEQFR